MSASSSEVLSPAEESIMKIAFKATMLRAAEITDAITDADVNQAQMALFREGVSIANLAKVDRALLASCHLRACAEMGEAAQVSTDDVRKLLKA